MSDYGIKISKPGFNAQFAPDNKLIFNSKYPLLKIFKQGNGKVTPTVSDGMGSGGLIEGIKIPHNLGYKPMFLAWTQSYDGNGVFIPTFKPFSFTEPGITVLGISEYSAYSDEENLNLSWYNPYVFSVIPVKFIYYIFEDPILNV